MGYQSTRPFIGKQGDPSDSHIPPSFFQRHSTSQFDRRFACAPFFLPSPVTGSSSSSSPIRNPSRLRGGGKRHVKPSNHRRNDTATTSRIKTRSSRSSPLTDLDKLKIEENGVRAEISRLSLVLRDVEGDGNCLFRALSDQLYGDQKRHAEMRKLTCDYLEAHEMDLGFWAQVCSFLDGEDYAAYVKRMRKSGQYASEVEVNAAARMLKRDIRIIHSDHSETIPCTYDPSCVPSATPEPPHHDAPGSPEEPLTPLPEAMSPLTPVRPGQRVRTRSSTVSLLSTPGAPPPSSPAYISALKEYLPPARDGRSMLWLALFNDAEHYQSIRRKGDRERGPAEVDDRLALPHEKDKSESAKIARGEIDLPVQSTRSQASALLQVTSSLPPYHSFTAAHISGVLSRTKGHVGEAVDILLEEINEEADMDGESVDTSSDHKVEAMLVDSSDDPTPTHVNFLQSGVSYRDTSNTNSASPSQRLPSPTGSTISSTSSLTQSNASESDANASQSSKATTPSSGSIKSGSSSSLNKKLNTKPYDRPRKSKNHTGSRKVKELSRELEELVVASVLEKRDEEKRRAKLEEGARRRNSLEEFQQARRNKNKIIKS